MNLKDLIVKYKWGEVRTALCNLYTDSNRNIEGYKLVFEKLKIIEHQESEYEIVVQNMDDNGQKYVHVNARSLSEKESDSSPMTYSLMLTPWNEWAGMAVNSESLENFSEVDVIAHCIWEMTFSGFDEEEIRKMDEGLNR
ncbi:hypothetical protein DF185_09210 [Marinifilum breve]|uniref:Uncharacterized protein n=1 Tax=Marinifilum breve TaxID=2184082 RepID=A0A2V4A1A9_9BACT|nr:DUF6557 family protein [Marinifilum breve]PXY01637.1 hypothetical protein DF185_09210 [Marinifilum breve]